MADVQYLDREGQYFFEVIDSNWAQTNAGSDQLFIKARALSFWNERLNPPAWDESVSGRVTSIYLYPLQKDNKTPNDAFTKQMRAAFGYDGLDLSVLAPEKLIGQFFQASVRPHRKYRGSFECGWIMSKDDTGESRPVKEPVKKVELEAVAERIRNAREGKAAGPVAMPPARK